VLGPNRRGAASVLATLLLAMSSPSDAAAQASCSGPVGGGPGPIRRAESHVGQWDLQVVSENDCRRGVHVDLTARQNVPGDLFRAQSPDHQGASSSVVSIPIYCRRDDYLFLPPGALGGLPCASVPRDEHFDPYPLAVSMAADLPPPDLRIGMNPALGMVAVPTWFWVEGYDGGLLSQSESVLEAHENCHFVVVRDADHHPILDEDGRPRVRRECTVETTTFTVDVRLWPGRLQWDFGDNHGRSIGCPDQGDCAEALGQIFIDSSHPSPIQHPYAWSSLGVNGDLDAYTVKLGITFAAQYRVTVSGNGAGTNGWRSLPERELSWTANHQVQEAQAVLTRP
jgi:hypothetical protein